jgi:paraquat-inducible protein B
MTTETAEGDGGSHAKQPLPRARRTRRPRIPWIWLVPIFALGFVGWLMARNYMHRGPRIEIQFPHSEGIEIGKSQVRFRGARVGLVTGLKLTPDLQGVQVTVDLIKSAEHLARTGTTFWIVRPEVTIERIRGLGAIVSGNYIEVRPGTGAKTNKFVGSGEAPVLSEHKQGLKIVLFNPKVGSVQKGTAIYYRGVQVGEVLGLQLTPDAQAVSITAHVDEQYAPLVRENSRFWNAGGLQMNVGLFSGAEIRAESVRSLVAGGIAFATPDPPGRPVKNGDAFRLFDKGEEDWEKWAPKIEIPAGNVPVAPRETTGR